MDFVGRLIKQRLKNGRLQCFLVQNMKILHADPLTAHIPIIALSANAVPRDIVKGMEAGFFNYITKPIKVGQFMEALDMALLFSQTAARRATTQELAK